MNRAVTEIRDYSIQETSRISGLSESTLRYYESIGLIDPIARDTSSHHRRYSERDLDSVIATACLNATGMSIPDMRAYLRNRAEGASSAADQIELLERQRRRLADEVVFVRLRQQYIDVKVAYWRAVRDDDAVSVRSLTAQAHDLAALLRSARSASDKEAA
jgi:DNA-binding transcriptional MerR regulator